MDSRRGFLKKAMLLAGATGISELLPASIQKAFSINPAPGTTFMDAEHVVLLMQENRSFDHTFGSLQGVRGFNDPRAINLPDGLPVWAQSNEQGHTYLPFRFNIKDTKATWMGSLPHGWADQVDARNNGKYDRWLQVKKSGNNDYAGIPMTMGYYTREDLPFYYALADAFTICDQHFCSSLTGTTPNRLHFWTGTIRGGQDANADANVWNEDVDYDSMASWKTFPERLEENGIAWKIYQNDISVDGGFTGEEDAWLSNFTDNPLEFFSQYNVKLSPRYIQYLEKMAAILPDEISELEKKFRSLPQNGKEVTEVRDTLQKRKALLAQVSAEKLVYTREKYESLTPYEKGLHEKAFATNAGEPDYRALTTLKYTDAGEMREINIPKGDVLYQFRKDVENGNLPAVSWIVAPENFSDHPDSAWFGAWYVSEVLDILTKNPEVWQKTIFVLTYDENDGYFDHFPPFTAPHPHDPATGKTSASVDTAVDYVTLKQDRDKKGSDEKRARESPIGLGYRVPLVIASPWSRGGYVCSQVFDHTSTLQFLEKFLSMKTGKDIRESNISAWRRAICGDLTSIFRAYNGEKITLPAVIARDQFIETIDKARFKKPPNDYKRLSAQELRSLREGKRLPIMPEQEKGKRLSNALPYEIYVEGSLSGDRKFFQVSFEERTNAFGERTAGVPFQAYLHRYNQEAMRVMSYAVVAGDKLSQQWLLDKFDGGKYRIAIHGPNGFYRLFTGNENDPEIITQCTYEPGSGGAAPLTGNILLLLKNDGNSAVIVNIKDHYAKSSRVQMLNAGDAQNVLLNLQGNDRWYDFSVTVNDNEQFEKRYAGRIENGRDGYTDPAMG